MIAATVSHGLRDVSVLVVSSATPVARRLPARLAARDVGARRRERVTHVLLVADADDDVVMIDPVTIPMTLRRKIVPDEVMTGSMRLRDSEPLERV